MLDYGSSEEEVGSLNKPLVGLKRAREGESASSKQSKKSDCVDTLRPQPARSFKTLDTDVRSATLTARRAANALFERRAGFGVAVEGHELSGGIAVVSGAAEEEYRGLDGGVDSDKFIHSAPPSLSHSATSVSIPSVSQGDAALGVSATLDAATLSLLDARSRRELGLDSEGCFKGMSGFKSKGCDLDRVSWGIPSTSFSEVGVLEVSGSAVRGRAWEISAIEIAQQTAAAAAERKSAPTIVSKVWNHSTGRAESSSGLSKAQKGKHQSNSLAAAAMQTNLKAADRAAEAAIHASFLRHR